MPAGRCLPAWSRLVSRGAAPGGAGEMRAASAGAGAPAGAAAQHVAAAAAGERAAGGARERERAARAEDGAAPRRAAAPLLPARALLERYVDLRAFAEHAERLRRSPDGFSREYAEAKRHEDSAAYRASLTPSTAPVRERNRYADVITCEPTRARLSGAQDYINANLISGEPATRGAAFIAAQAPLPSTAEDFWRMVCEYDAPAVAMLTTWRDSTGGSVKVKADPYFPERPGETQRFGAFTVACVELDESEAVNGLTVRQLRVESSSSSSSNTSSRQVYHVHFVNWPDFGCVDNIEAYLALHSCVDRHVAAVRSQQAQGHGPVVTHCSAGVGRTGTYVAIDLILRQLRSHVAAEEAGAAARATAPAAAALTRLVIDVRGTVQKLREQRPMMVATTEQYAMVYQVLQRLLSETASGGEVWHTAAVANELRALAADNDAYRKLSGGPLKTNPS
jgi:protein tyrosine phosphatase